MKNYIKPGKMISFVAAAAVLSGQGLLIGTLFGVVAADAAIGEGGEMAIHGVYSLPKATGASTGGAQGTAAYWDDTAKKVTAVSTSNTLIGKFNATCANGDTTCEVILLP